MSHMLTPCKEDFTLLQKKAGSVKRGCGKSERAEELVFNDTETYLIITLKTLRDARELKPADYPADEAVLDYLIEKIRTMYSDVKRRLDETLED